MIFDTIAHLPHYLPSEVWKDLESFLSRLDSEMPEGKHWIREPDMFAQVSSYKTKASNEGRFETHERYADVQILQSGSEMIDVTPRECLTPDTDYDEQNDIRFWKAVDVSAVRLTMMPDSFALVFPRDAHCPQLTPHSGIQDVKKVVIKIDVRLLHAHGTPAH